MAVGAPDAFLPGLVKQISAAGTEAERILFLHALKEVSWSLLTSLELADMSGHSTLFTGSARVTRRPLLVPSLCSRLHRLIIRYRRR